VDLSVQDPVFCDHAFLYHYYDLLLLILTNWYETTWLVKLASPSPLLLHDHCQLRQAVSLSEVYCFCALGMKRFTHHGMYCSVPYILCLSRLFHVFGTDILQVLGIKEVLYIEY
jgi:hypothetical protein